MSSELLLKKQYTIYQKIILKEFEELSYEEIANILGKTENWTRVTFFRAKQKLKEIYTAIEGRNEGED
jgi:RNA polymerase sigma-70 factor, ECF subfamily